MRRLLKIAFVGMLVQTMPGCGLQPGNEESNAATQSNSQQPTATFEQPSMTTQNLERNVIAANSLIQPTNPNQRTKQVQKGRVDPFAGLFVSAAPSVSISPQSQPTVVAPRSTPRLAVPPPVETRTRPRSNVNTGNPQQRNPSKVNPLAVAPTTETNVLPPTPPMAIGSNSEPFSPPPPQNPDLATAVAVTGVVQVGSEPHAIVKVPNETTSRYVRVGQRLSNGQVLVKRIEISEGSDPVVILEQDGVEVSKAVGEAPANPAQAAIPTASSVIPLDSMPAVNAGSATPPPPPVPAAENASPVAPSQDNAFYSEN